MDINQLHQVTGPFLAVLIGLYFRTIRFVSALGLSYSSDDIISITLPIPHHLFKLLAERIWHCLGHQHPLPSEHYTSYYGNVALNYCSGISVSYTHMTLPTNREV